MHILKRIFLDGTLWAEVAALRGEMSALLAKQKQSAEAGSPLLECCATCKRVRIGKALMTHVSQQNVCWHVVAGKSVCSSTGFAG